MSWAGLPRRWLYESIGAEPLLRARRRTLLASRVVVLMYHEVLEDDCDIEAWTVVRQRDFERQMEYLRRASAVVPLDEALEALQRRRPTSPMTVVTFDDGYAGNRRVVLPIVEALGIPITVFVATAAVADQSVYWYDRVIMVLQHRSAFEVDLSPWSLRRYRFAGSHRPARHWNEIQRLLSDLKELAPESRGEVVTAIEQQRQPAKPLLRALSVSEVRELSMSPYVTVGAHSHCHNRLCQLSPDGVRQTVVLSKRLIENWTGNPVKHFAYPNGDYTPAIVAEVRAAGFASAATTNRRVWTGGDSPFEVPRIGVGRYDTFRKFKCNVSGILL